MRSYLVQLTLQLAAGMAELPDVLRERHTAYLAKSQRPDGGFAGREGDSDLYYTSFGLRSLSMLGALYGDPAKRAADFLRSRLLGRETVVDLLSLIYGASLLDMSAGIDVFADAPRGWHDALSDRLEEFRRPDGGYAKAAEGQASSTYHSFLVLLCRQLIDRPLPEPQRMVQFILSQQSPGGGFREIRAGKRAGTNPTAAAVGVLRILDALDEGVCRSTIQFLAEMQTDEGGLRANTRIPIADLLSSMTGVLTLMDLGGLDQIDRDAARAYVLALESPDGGFRAAAWDDACDVEYTFYGLGCLALLTAEVSRGDK
jgi:geranylgeranyl transferase type-2 subunit beta